MIFNKLSLLGDVHKFLRANFRKGTDCPACGQHVQQYEYKLFATSAMALIQLYKLDRDNPGEYFHIKKYAEANEGRPRAPHFAELRFWGLVVKAENTDTRKKSSGYWAITQKGRDFVEGKTSVASRILVYNNTFCGFSEKSININIRTALDNEFDFREVMGEDFFERIESNLKLDL